jgi:hypothetical protein
MNQSNEASPSSLVVSTPATLSLLESERVVQILAMHLPRYPRVYHDKLVPIPSSLNNVWLVTVLLSSTFAIGPQQAPLVIPVVHGRRSANGLIILLDFIWSDLPS